MSRRSVTEPPVLLALDIGAKSVRAALYDGFGKEIEETEARVEMVFARTPDGGAELDASEAVEQVARAVDITLERSADLSGRVEVVALSCFWQSLLGVDEDGRAVTPVYGPAERRAASAAEELRVRFDEPVWHARTGCRFDTAYWPARFLWLRLDREEIFQSARRWMSFAEFFILRLFGETAMSVSLASGTGLLNLRGCAWEDELLRGLQVSLDQLPRIAQANEVFTGLQDEYARRWPNLRHILWYPAIGDGAAHNIGEGCMTPARSALMIDAFGEMRVMWSGSTLAQLPPALWCQRADYHRLLVGGTLADGGELTGWLRESFAQGDGQSEARESAVASMEPDAHGLTLLPFWGGERSIGWSNSARGAILGMTMRTKPADILRAAMEAIAYRLAFIAGTLEHLAPGLAIVASGKALLEAPAWAQMIADVFGRPLMLSGVQEAVSRGAALLALELAGKIANIAAVPVPPGLTYQPDAARHARYRRGLERQRKIYEHLILDQELARLISGAAHGRDQAGQDEG